MVQGLDPHWGEHMPGRYDTDRRSLIRWFSVIAGAVAAGVFTSRAAQQRRSERARSPPCPDRTRRRRQIGLHVFRRYTQCCRDHLQSRPDLLRTLFDRGHSIADGERTRSDVAEDQSFPATRRKQFPLDLLPAKAAARLDTPSRRYVRICDEGVGRQGARHGRLFRNVPARKCAACTLPTLWTMEWLCAAR